MELNNLDTWIAPFNGLWMDLAPVLPRLAAAFAVLILGLLLSGAIRALARSVFSLAGLDRRFSELWLFRLWSRSHQGQAPSQGISRMAYYGGIFVTTLLAIRALGSGMHSGIFESLLSVVPRVLSVVLILVLSGLLANFVSFAVQLVMAGSQLPHSVFWGKAAAWATFGAGIMFSLEPLGLAGQILGQAVLIVIGALALAAGLAFGLGCKDLAREFLLQIIAEDKES